MKDIPQHNKLLIRKKHSNILFGFHIGDKMEVKSLKKKYVCFLAIFLCLFGCSINNKESSNHLFPIIQKGKFGYINENGKTNINPQFEFARPYFGSYANIKINSKWGFINKDGEMAIKPIYEITAIRFSENTVSVSLNNKDGLIDVNGKQIIPFAFEYLGNIFEGTSAVKLNGKWGYIKEDGSYLIEPQYDYVDIFQNGYAVCFKGDYSYLINKKGEVLLSYKDPKMIEYFEEGILVILEFAEGDLVKIGGEGKTYRQLERHYWFVDTTGKRLNDKIYFYVNPFSEGFAYVSEEYGNCYFINKKGEKVFDANTDTILGESYFKNGYAPIKGKTDLSIGYINTEGKIVIPPYYGKHIEIPAKPFSEELVAILDTTPNKEQVNLYGYMNDKAEWVIKPQFYRAYNFTNGLAKVYIDDKHEWSYVNKQGKIVWKSEDLRKGQIIEENFDPIMYREFRGYGGFAKD